jgi:hypothetical protein
MGSIGLQSEEGQGHSSHRETTVVVIGALLESPVSPLRLPTGAVACVDTADDEMLFLLWYRDGTSKCEECALALSATILMWRFDGSIKLPKKQLQCEDMKNF